MLPYKLSDWNELTRSINISEKKCIEENKNLLTPSEFAISYWTSIAVIS